MILAYLQDWNRGNAPSAMNYNTSLNVGYWERYHPDANPGPYDSADATYPEIEVTEGAAVLTANAATQAGLCFEFFFTFAGMVSVLVDTPGAAGNSWRLQITTPAGTNTSLTATLSGTDITVALGRTGGALDSTKNTYPLVAAAINALAGVSATSKGTHWFTGAWAWQNFRGGYDANDPSTVDPEGNNVFDLQPSTAGDSRGETYVTTAVVIGDMGTLTIPGSSVYVPSLDQNVLINGDDLGYITGQRGRAKIYNYFRSAGWDDNTGSPFAIILRVGVNYFTGSGGLELDYYVMSGAGSDGQFSITAHNVGTNPSGIVTSPSYVSAASSAFNQTSLENAWHSFQIDWQCGTPDLTPTVAFCPIYYTGAQRLVTITADTAGNDGNRLRVASISKALTANHALVVTSAANAIGGQDITIVLGTNGANALDNTKNTATLICAAINGLSLGATATTTVPAQAADSFTISAGHQGSRNGGLITSVAADGWITVSMDGVEIINQQNIALCINADVRTPNCYRDLWLGFYGTMGPVGRVALYTASLPSCEGGGEVVIVSDPPDGSPFVGRNLHPETWLVVDFDE